MENDFAFLFRNNAIAATPDENPYRQNSPYVQLQQVPLFQRRASAKVSPLIPTSETDPGSRPSSRPSSALRVNTASSRRSSIAGSRGEISSPTTTRMDRSGATTPTAQQGFPFLTPESAASLSPYLAAQRRKSSTATQTPTSAERRPASTRSRRRKSAISERIPGTIPLHEEPVLNRDPSSTEASVSAGMDQFARKKTGSNPEIPIASQSIMPVPDEPGRIKVHIRARPLSPENLLNREPVSLRISEDSKRLTIVDQRREVQYAFDRVFSMETDNRQVFEEVGKPIVMSCVNGYNGTLLAYGQTGSGKTHTLASPDGLIPRIVNRLFRKVTADMQHEYKVTFSFIQIYQEKIYDLLVPQTKQTSADLALRENPQTGVYVENMSEFVVRGAKEVFELLKIGTSRLIFSETKMNRLSSRWVPGRDEVLLRNQDHLDKH